MPRSLEFMRQNLMRAGFKNEEIAKEIKRRQELEISKYLSERKPRKD